MPDATLPTKLLSGRLFLGQLPAPGDTNRAALARFARAEDVAQALREASRRGYGGLMTLGDERVAAALEMLRRADEAPAVLPVIPNVPGYVREATEHGMAGAGLRRLARVGPLGFVRVGLTGAFQAHRVLRKDFTTLMSILYALEMGEFGRFAPPAVVLHHQMCDLALAFGKAEFFHAYARRMRAKFRSEPALATSNLPLLAARLAEWRVDIRLLVAPLNRHGFLMAGGLPAYRRALEGGRFELIAERLDLAAPTPPDAIGWALEQNFVRAVVADETLQPAEEPATDAA